MPSRAVLFHAEGEIVRVVAIEANERKYDVQERIRDIPSAETTRLPFAIPPNGVCRLVHLLIAGDRTIDPYRELIEEIALAPPGLLVRLSHLQRFEVDKILRTVLAQDEILRFSGRIVRLWLQYDFRQKEYKIIAGRTAKIAHMFDFDLVPGQQKPPFRQHTLQQDRVIGTFLDEDFHGATTSQCPPLSGPIRRTRLSILSLVKCFWTALGQIPNAAERPTRVRWGCETRSSIRRSLVF